MEDETNSLEKRPVVETHKIEPPTFWRWYFGWHPRLFLTIPTFLIFAYQGVWFIGAEIQDIIYFFQTKPVTWGSIFLIMFLGSALISFIIMPIYICFASLVWLYEISIGNNTAWRKFLYSIGIVLLVFVGADVLHLFTNWIIGIF